MGESVTFFIDTIGLSSKYLERHWLNCIGWQNFCRIFILNWATRQIGFSSEAPTKVKETVHTKAEHCIVTLTTVKDGVVCSIDDDNSFVFKLMLRELLDSVYLDNDLHVCATNSGNAVLVYVHDKVIIYKIPETLSKVGISNYFLWRSR